METNLFPIATSVAVPNHVKNSAFYYQLTIQFLKILRGDLDQRKLSQMLGYSFNKVGKWESAVTQFKWVDFLKMGNALNLSIKKNLNHYFGNYEGSFSSEEILKYLEVFLALRSISDYSVQHLLKKWKSANVSPDLAEIFMILDCRPTMLIGFLSQYIDCSQLELIKDEFKLFNHQLSILSQDPNAGYVNEALKVKEYRILEFHDEKLLARHSGCSIEQLRKTLSDQAKLGTFYFDGKKYFPSIFDFSFASLNNSQIRKFHKYTFTLVAKKYPLEPSQCLPGHTYNSSCLSNRVVAISRDASIKIDKLISKFHNDVGEIIKNDDQEKDNVQIISLASVVSAIEVAGGE